MTERRLTFTDGHPDAEWLGALHDGELTTGEAREVEAHAAACPACRQLLADLAELSELTPRLEPPLPGEAYWPGLTDRILDRVADAHDDAAPVAAAAGARRAAVASAAEAPRAAYRPDALTTRRPAWRWLVPLAAACGVALLSWRLLLSRPSLVSEVGNPRPEYRARAVQKESSPAPADLRAADAASEPPAAPEQTLGQLARKDAPRLGAAAPPPLADRQAIQSMPADKSADGQANPAPAAGGAVGSTASTLPAPTSETLSSEPPPAVRAEAEAPVTAGAAASEKKEQDVDQAARGGGALLEEPPPPLDEYRARLAAGVPLDSVLAESGREVERLWGRLGPAAAEERGAAPRDFAASAAQNAARPAAPSAAPMGGASPAAPDSLTLERVIAIEEARLTLLKELDPGADRREIEARLAWLRKIRKKQGP